MFSSSIQYNRGQQFFPGKMGDCLFTNKIAHLLTGLYGGAGMMKNALLSAQQPGKDIALILAEAIEYI